MLRINTLLNLTHPPSLISIPHLLLADYLSISFFHFQCFAVRVMYDVNWFLCVPFPIISAG